MNISRLRLWLDIISLVCCGWGNIMLLICSCNNRLLDHNWLAHSSILHCSISLSNNTWAWNLSGDNSSSWLSKNSSSIVSWNTSSIVVCCVCISDYSTVGDSRRCRITWDIIRCCKIGDNSSTKYMYIYLWVLPVLKLTLGLIADI